MEYINLRTWILLFITITILVSENVNVAKKLKKPNVSKPNKPNNPWPDKPSNPGKPNKPTVAPTTAVPSVAPTTAEPTATVLNNIENTFREATCDALEDVPLWNGLSHIDLDALNVFQSLQMDGETPEIDMRIISEHQFCTEMIFAAMSGAVLQAIEVPLDAAKSVLNAIPFNLGDALEDALVDILDEIFGASADIDDLTGFLNDIQRIATGYAYKICDLVYGNPKKLYLEALSTKLSDILNNELSGVNDGDFTISARYGGKLCWSSTFLVCMTKTYGVAVNVNNDVRYTESRGIEYELLTDEMGFGAKQFGDVHFYANINDIQGNSYAIGPSLVIPGLAQILEQNNYDISHMSDAIELIQAHIDLVPANDKVLEFMAVLLQRVYFDGTTIGFSLNFGVDSFALSDVLSANCAGVFIDQVNAASTVSANFKREKVGDYKSLSLGMEDFELDNGIDNTLADVKKGIQLAREIKSLLKQPIMTAVNEITGFFKDIVRKIKKGFEDAIKAIIEPFKAIGINTANKLKGFGRDLVDAFKAIGITSADGIIDAAQQLKSLISTVERLENYVDDAEKAFCSLFKVADDACDKFGYLKDKIKKKVPNGGDFLDKIGFTSLKRNVCESKSLFDGLNPCSSAKEEMVHLMEEDEEQLKDWDSGDDYKYKEDYFVLNDGNIYFYAIIGCIALLVVSCSLMLNVYFVCFGKQNGIKYSSLQYMDSADETDTDVINMSSDEHAEQQKLK